MQLRCCRERHAIFHGAVADAPNAKRTLGPKRARGRLAMGSRTTPPPPPMQKRMPAMRPHLAPPTLGTLNLPSWPARAVRRSRWTRCVGQVPPGGTRVGRGVAVGRLPGGGGEAACQSQLPAAAYARPNGPLKPSRQLISTTWNVFVANL